MKLVFPLVWREPEHFEQTAGAGLLDERSRPGQEEVAGTPAVAEPVADPLAADPIDATADINVDAEAGGEAVDVNVDVQDGALGRARR